MVQVSPCPLPCLYPTSPAITLLGRSPPEGLRPKHWEHKWWGQKPCHLRAQDWSLTLSYLYILRYNRWQCRKEEVQVTWSCAASHLFSYILTSLIQQRYEKAPEWKCLQSFSACLKYRICDSVTSSRVCIHLSPPKIINISFKKNIKLFPFNVIA